VASYAERIERYLTAHPGASLAEARGHGHTPERPGQGREQERFSDYYERRNAAEAHTNQLKADMFGQEPSYNADSAAQSTSRIPLADLEAAMAYDSLDDYADDMGGWDEIDDDFGYYH
jgi:hypothetical protein